MFAAYRAKFLDLATEVDQMQRRELPNGWAETFPSSPPILRVSPAERRLAKYLRAPLKIQVSRQDNARVKILSAAYKLICKR